MLRGPKAWEGGPRAQTAAMVKPWLTDTSRELRKCNQWKEPRNPGTELVSATHPRAQLVVTGPPELHSVPRV